MNLLEAVSSMKEDPGSKWECDGKTYKYDEKRQEIVREGPTWLAEQVSLPFNGWEPVDSRIPIESYKHDAHEVGHVIAEDEDSNSVMFSATVYRRGREVKVKYHIPTPDPDRGNVYIDRESGDVPLTVVSTTYPSLESHVIVLPGLNEDWDWKPVYRICGSETEAKEYGEKVLESLQYYSEYAEAHYRVEE